MRTIIVIGHDRSGTSLTAGVLHKLGVNMGPEDRWRPADEANEAGYFENSDFVEANQAMIEQGRTPDLGEIVKKHEDELWGCKDPRFLHTFSKWKEHLTNPMVIICRRKPESIAKSVCFRDDGKYTKKKEYKPTLKGVAEYYKKALAFQILSDCPTLSVRFEEYFTGQENIKKIAEFIGVPYREVNLADENLRHF